MSLYHFVALNKNSFQKVILSKRQTVDPHLSQCLHDLQIEALEFLDKCLSRNEFCIYNDENGLGKTTVVSVLLGTIGKNKKTLILVQNGEEYINNWLFHISVLSGLPVCVINGASDSTESPHNVYIAKWTTIRMIGDLSKFNFDWIIVDNKGATLNNNFCYSMLVKNFQRKVNIFIASTDVTSDVKLLHNILRLGGRLDPQYESYKKFIEKFKLPDGTEIAKNKVDLEDYFSKRAMLCDFVKKFRLRRYKHQYESILPFVTEDEFKKNLQQWLDVQKSKLLNAVEIIDSSGSSSMNGGTYCNGGIKEKGRVKELISSDKVVKRSCSVLNKTDPTPSQLQFENLSEAPQEETEIMSPLLFLSDEESDEFFKFPENEVFNHSSEVLEYVEESPPDKNQNVEVNPPPLSLKTKGKNDEIISLSSSSLEEVQECVALPSPPRKKTTRNIEKSPKPSLNKRRANINGCDETEEGPSTSKKSKTISPKVPKKRKMKVEISSDEEEAQEEEEEEDQTIIMPPPSTKKKPLSIKVEPGLPKRKPKLEKPEIYFRETRCTRWSRTTRSSASKQKTQLTNFALGFDNDKKPRRSAPAKLCGTCCSPCVERKEKLVQITKVFNERKSYTRFSGGSNNNTTTRPRRGDTKVPVKAEPRTPQSSTSRKSIMNKNSTEATTLRKSPQKAKDKVSQISLLSMPSSFEDIQCGQRLDTLSEVNLPQLRNSGSAEFLVPSSKALTAKNSSTCPESSDLIFISPPVINDSKKKPDIVEISSADESSVSSLPCEFSRRTLALKPKKIATKFSSLVGLQAYSARDRSPDLFSICSDFNSLNCTQRNNKTNSQNNNETNEPFGFKMFGSEVKQFQQKYAEREANSGGPFARKNTRSCLNILENMLDPASRGNSNAAAVFKDAFLASSKKELFNKRKSKKVKVPIVPSHPIAAIEKNKEKLALEKAAKEEKRRAQNEALEKRRISTRRSSSLYKRVKGSEKNEMEMFEIISTGEVVPSNNNQSPSQHPQKNKLANKITNYFAGNQTPNATTSGKISGKSNDEEEEHRTTPKKRPSSVNLKRTPKTQATKLTRWLTKSDNNNEEPSQTTPMKKSPFKKAAEINMALQEAAELKNLKNKANQRRRRLDLSKD